MKINKQAGENADDMMSALALDFSVCIGLKTYSISDS